MVNILGIPRYADRYVAWGAYASNCVSLHEIAIFASVQIDKII